MKSDNRVLACLQDFYARNRALPSYAEAARLCGLPAVSTVAGVIARLKEQGFLQASDTGRLRPGKRFFERSLANTVQAGLPASAEEVLPEGVLIDEYLVDHPSRTVLLTVKGESMTQAGLLPTDIVIVKRGAPARPGDIVVAIVDGEFTVKYLALDGSGEFYLKPGNPSFPDIRPREGLEVFGVVIGQFRRYRQAGAGLGSKEGADLHTC
jgi:repressor LexA